MENYRLEPSDLHILKEEYPFPAHLRLPLLSILYLPSLLSFLLLPTSMVFPWRITGERALVLLCVLIVLVALFLRDCAYGRSWHWCTLGHICVASSAKKVRVAGTSPHNCKIYIWCCRFSEMKHKNELNFMWFHRKHFQWERFWNEFFIKHEIKAVCKIGWKSGMLFHSNVFHHLVWLLFHKEEQKNEFNFPWIHRRAFQIERSWGDLFFFFVCRKAKVQRIGFYGHYKDTPKENETGGIWRSNGMLV